MQFSDESGLKLELNIDNYTAKVIKQPDTNDTVFIPRSVEFEGNKFIIKTLGSFSLKNAKSVTFPNDSEVESFESSSFYLSEINKLQIPSSLKYLKDGWCDKLKGLTQIEISPDNKFFYYLDNQFLVGKSDENNRTYDILYYLRYDIEEAIIPPQIKTITRYSLSSHINLKTIIFKSKSKITKIEDVLSDNQITKLVLPPSIEKISDDDFKNVPNLIDISIPKKKQNIFIH